VAEVRRLPAAIEKCPRRAGLAKGAFVVPASFSEPLPDDMLASFGAGE